MFETELQRQTFIAHGWTFPPCIHCGQPADRHGCPHPRDGDESDDCTGYDADLWAPLPGYPTDIDLTVIDEVHEFPADPGDQRQSLVSHHLGLGHRLNLVIVDEVQEFPDDLPETP